MDCNLIWLKAFLHIKYLIIVLINEIYFRKCVIRVVNKH